MRVTQCFVEAMRNLTSGTVRAGWLVPALVAGTILMALLDVLTVNGILRSAYETQQRGGDIHVVSSEAGIDGRACDALGQQPGVSGAGAITRERASAAVGLLPQNPLPVLTITPGLVMLLTGEDHADPGVLLSTAAAEQMGVRTGDVIHTSGGTTRVSGTYKYPDDGRQPGLGYAMLAPRPADAPFDECWVKQFPRSSALTSLLMTVVLPDASREDAAKVSRLNSTLGVIDNPGEALAARPSRIMAAGAAILGASVGALAVWLRRVELAATLHAGLHKASLLLVLIAESMAWTLIAVIACLPVLFALSNVNDHQDYWPVFTTGLSIPIAASAAAILGTIAAGLAIREKRLFALFKGR